MVLASGARPSVSTAEGAGRSTLRLTPAVLLLTIGLSAVTASGMAFTFFYPGVLRGPAVMNGSARGTALAALVLATPALIAATMAAVRVSKSAAIVLLGAATYLLYNSVLFLFATPFNNLFIFYVAMFTLSFWTIVTVVCELNVPSFARVFASERLPARALAAYLGLIAVLNIALWLSSVIPAVMSTRPPAFLEGTGLTTMPTFAQDLSFWLPATLVVAVWLWRRTPWGVVFGGALFVYGFIEGIGVAVDQAFGHAADPASNVAGLSAVPIFLALAATEAVALFCYFRGLNRG